MIAIQALEGGYGESPVLRGVALDVSRGEIFAILGKNGMGKTTLLKTIMGLLPAKKGRVELLGQDVTGWPPYRITRLGVSYVPPGEVDLPGPDGGGEPPPRASRRGQFRRAAPDDRELVPGLEGAAATARGDALGGRAEDASHRTGAPHPPASGPRGRDHRRASTRHDHGAHRGPGGGAAGARPHGH